jgi:hypothetical protein
MDSYENLVEEKRKAGEIDWLASQLSERHRINVDLVTENARLATRIGLQVFTIQQLEQDRRR